MDSSLGLLGREAEARQLATLLSGARNGRGGSLFLLGAPGIGKTTLLGSVAHAGMRQLRVTGYEAESTSPFAALYRLMLPLQSHVVSLSDRHQSALRVAAGVDPGPPPDRFLVGMGVLALVAAAGETTPLVCSVDDAHHLDPESMEALAFVARRLEAESVALVFAGRDEPHLIERIVGIPVLHLQGLGPAAAIRLLQSALPEPMDPAAAAQIAMSTGGNPLALVDLATELDVRRLTHSSLADEPIPVGRHLETFYLRRVRQLAPELQLWLLLASADSTGSFDLIRSAAATLEVPDAAGEDAELAGLVALSATVDFRHPLVRSAVYNAASGTDRRRVHRALSLAAGGHGLVELEAWHASKATLGSDPKVAERLEKVADLAGRRGGLLSRANVLAQASALTPAGDVKAARLVSAGEAASAAGAVQVSKALLDDLDPSTVPPAVRGRLISLQAMHAVFTGDPVLVRGTARMLEAASCFDGIDADAEQAALIRAFEYCLPAERLVDGVELAVLGKRLSEGAALRLGVNSTVLTALGALIELPYDEAVPLMRRAVDAINALPQAQAMTYVVVGVALTTALWDADGRREVLERAAQGARDAGALQVLDTTLWTMSLAELKGGTPKAAGEGAEQVRELRRAIGYDAEQVVNPAYLAWNGAPRPLVWAVCEAALAMGFGGVHSAGVAALAVRDLAEGHYRDAYTTLQPLIDEPFLHVTPLDLADFVEAAVRAGHPAEAMPHVRRLEEMARANESRWTRAIAERSRALVDDDPEPLYLRAIATLEPTDIEVERGRSHLLYGEWLRRTKRRRDARDQLRMAVDLFERSQAPIFVQRAQNELTATGLTSEAASEPQPLGLTSQELTVARLAESGSTNAEIGATLFISTNTVDYHLRKVFQKLGISSRRQLRERFRAGG
ncbi:AAA family ATPase [Knoellia sp. S7-12]|uniref:helix-turn-helix transcriptional regulator n=1 Tax=Knoellia sp. S7-12 TaxID=3126698 RepID=UPI0033665F3E